MSQVNLPGNLGQIKGLLQGSIAAAYHHYGLVPEKEAVAGGAVGNPPAVIIQFPGNLELTGAAPGGQNHAWALSWSPLARRTVDN